MTNEAAPPAPSSLPQLHRVSSVQSPAAFLLDKDYRVRLIGVRPNADRLAEALQFLRRITDGRDIFIKRDKVLQDAEGTDLVYMYLDDGAFLNALLVKYDLIDVEDTIPFKYRERFLNKQQDNRNPNSAASAAR